jgi:uncharacterized UPF0160 family protein
MKKIKHGGITHNGVFHADDVLSSCLLKLINPSFTYRRTSDIPKEFKGIVYDIGGGEYDHHTELKKRENGKNYAAFGLLWKDLGTYFMDKEHAKLFDDVFVSEIDRCDTTSNTNLLSSSIDYFNPNWNSKTESDAAFDYAVETFLPVLRNLIKHFKQSTFIPRYCKTIQEDLMIAFENISKRNFNKKTNVRYSNSIEAWNHSYKEIFQEEDNNLFIKTFLGQVSKTYGKYKTSPFILGMVVLPRKIRIDILERIIIERINSINALIPAEQECKKAYQESVRKDILIFNHYVPNSYLTEYCEETQVIVFPSERGGYNLLSLEMNDKEKCKSKSGNTKRFYFPEDLRGQEKNVLERFSEGLIFVHQAGFLATCEKLEQTISFYDKIKKG